MSASTEKPILGHSYFLGVQYGLCHGPIDKVTRIRSENRIIAEGDFLDGETISIYKPDLYGPDDAVIGDVDLAFGDPSQTQNPYLLGVQPIASENIPAYRGIACVILNQVNLGMRPQLRPWEFRAQRIHTSTRGAVQWYDDKSEVPGDEGEIVSTWDTSTLTLDQSSVTDPLFDGSATWVSLDGVYLIKAIRSSPGSVGDIHIWQMSTAFDLSTLSKLTGLKQAQLFTPSGLFAKDDGLKIFVYDRTTNRLRSFSLSTEWDITTATEVGSITFASTTSGLHFTSDGQYLYNASGSPRTTINQWKLNIPWSPSSGLVFQSSFSISSETTNNIVGITGKPDGSKIIVTTGSAGEIYGISITDIDDISSGIITDFGDPSIAITNSIHAVSNGEYLFGSSSQRVRRYAFEQLVQSGDMNPSHIIRECLTDTSWGLGYTAADIDDTSFTDAADTLFAEEFGISLLWSQQTPIEDFILDILRHIDGTLYVHPRTGKFTLKLIRDDYTVGTLPILDESNIISISDYKKPTIGELTNYVTVKYWDRSTSEDSAISVQDIALAQQQGSVVSSTIPMPGITRGSLATRVASRELTALSNPLITCTIIGNREAASLNIGDAFKLSWPKFGLTETVMRVTNAQFGTLTDGRVKIECVQDVFGLPTAVFSKPTDSSFVSPINAPANSPFSLVQEANYWTLIQKEGEDFTFDPLDGFLITAATKPTQDAIEYRIWTDETGSYVRKDSSDFCPTATITHDFPRVVDGVIQSVVGITGLAADEVADIDIGSIAQIGNEFLEVVSVSATSLAVGRAVADSPIEDHVTGDRIFFWGNSFFGSVDTLYQDNDTIGVKITPTTGQGELAIADATEQTLTFDQRAYRAWLPGNLTLNSVYFPSSVEGVETVDSAWAYRDRTLQTAGLNDFTESSIGPEVGTTYTTTLTRVNNSAQLDQNTGVTGTTDSLDPSGYDGLVRYEIKSVRDALDSFYSQTHEFIVTRTSAVQEEQGAFMLTEDNEAIITES